MDIHHIIPKEIYLEFEQELGSMFHMNDAIQNGIPLPSNWHNNHPAYSNWVRNGLKQLERSSKGITIHGVRTLKQAAVFHLENAKGISNMGTINRYWKAANIPVFIMN